MVTMFDCLHDMTDPQGMADTVRSSLAEDGWWLLCDVKGRDSYRENVERNPMAALMYGFSVLHCLTVAMADGAEDGTGTVIRSETMRAYAGAAGFAEVEILPIENDLWRFYRLTA